jgi:peptidyl-prolyl cis-trans isomerase SurA
MKACFAAAAMCIIAGAVPLSASAQTSPATAQQPVMLDRVEAIINGNVLLQSDVDEEMRFAVLEPLRVLPGQNTPLQAVRRLINRTLIVQQMKDQQQPVTVSGEKVTQALDELKKQLPACAKYHCETEEGWQAFLNANGLTEDAVKQRWSERLAILHFIDVRFRSGIRISKEQIEDYYKKTLLPALSKSDQPAPQLSAVAPRIQEILLQEEVSGLLRDWLKSLRDEGSVQIVDPAYASLGSGTADDEGDN